MALAQRLNELADANSEGLLNDDEYRLLRQNLFEQYSPSTVIPTEKPLVPLAYPSRTLPSPSSTRWKATIEPQVNPRTTWHPPTTSKPSIATGVTNLFRRVTGRKTSIPKQNSRDSPSTPSSDVQKKGIPRILQRKASQMFSIHTDSNRAEKHPELASLKPGNLSSDASHLLSPPHSPTRSPRRAAIPYYPPCDPSVTNDVFDTNNLFTSKDIRAAIIATETEAERVLEAFDSLELTTSHRVHRQTARRLPSATPTHANVLIEGRGWRDHSFQPPQSPRGTGGTRRAPSAVDVSDQTSVRSVSSIKTTLSQPKSVSSLRSKQPPTSPLSSRFPTVSSSIHRKASVSSMSSQAPSFKRIGVKHSLSLSRSTGNLPLGMLPEKGGMDSTDSIDLGAAEDGNGHTEVEEIRRRRREVEARYDARLEYLRAKLKGAELHEKLLRK